MSACVHRLHIRKEQIVQTKIEPGSPSPNAICHCKTDQTLPPLKIKAEVLHTSGLSRQIRIESRASCRTEQRARVALPVLYLK
ncbi:hypothetical protein I7I53_00991 [Histoplasma capsulatum var. duboisii H88]|uniref:Uncharacterized protein n=1 Tax=Ajellomyces capsulatus (strain H88) TaxID=544711 RepID=A0A8A1LH19_AJEC8|nr:hypothetical protein I7I53_00991 [Histoplasma capsulatum var. duboisii H88]